MHQILNHKFFMQEYFTFLNSQKSPRKSVQEYVSSVDDFVAPFENFLEESIMEEDFMLNDIDFSDDENDSEELKQDFIDEGKYKISCRIVVRVLTGQLQDFFKDGFVHLL